MQIKVSEKTAMGFRKYTVIGSIARAVNNASEWPLEISEVLDPVTGEVSPAKKIRTCLSKIADQEGCKFKTRAFGGGLKVWRIA